MRSNVCGGKVSVGGNAGWLTISRGGLELGVSWIQIVGEREHSLRAVRRTELQEGLDESPAGKPGRMIEASEVFAKSLYRAVVVEVLAVVDAESWRMREAGDDDARNLEPWKVQCRARAKAQPLGRLRLACLPAASRKISGFQVPLCILTLAVRFSPS